MSDKIHIDELHPSPTQPRKSFKQAELDELSNSMAQHGFAFGALLLRPRPEGRFEIVIGERRTRSARAAIDILSREGPWNDAAEEKSRLEKLDSLLYPPHRVRELSDMKVRELQLIENLQRSDLNPIEEAEGYRGLLDLVDPSGKPLHTIDTIAKRIGRDHIRVERRLALCSLAGEAKASVETGALKPEIAYLIARMPDEQLRDEAARRILHPEFEEGPLSRRRAEEEIAKLVRDLRKAKFDTKAPDLVPLRCESEKRLAGGACTDCPFRVADKQRTSCLNPSCFDEKTETEWQTWQARETDPEKKRRALSRDECSDLFSQQYPDQPTWSSGLVGLDQFPAGDELRPGESAPGSWRMMTANVELEILVARDRNWKAHELVKRDTAIAAAKLNGHDVFKATASDKRPNDTRASLGLTPPADLKPEPGATLEQTQEEWLQQPPTRDEREAHRKNAEKARAVNEERSRAVVYACFAELRKKAKPHTSFLRKLAAAIFSSRGAHEDLLKRYKLPVASDISQNIVRWKDAAAVAFIIELLVTDAGYNFELDSDDQAWLKLFGVDYVKTSKRLLEKGK